MMEILQFIFSDFLHFFGFLIIWSVPWSCIASIGKYKSEKDLDEE